MHHRFLFWRWRRPSKSPPTAPFIREVVLRTHERRKEPPMSTATLKWTVPTTRIDGSPLTQDQIAGFDVFDSTSTTPLVPVGTVPGAAGSFTTDVLAVGVHNFSVVCRDTSGHSSAASNVASVTVAPVAANPSAVSDLTATLNS